MSSLEMRKPVAGKATGFQNIEPLPGKFDTRQHATPACHLQASRIHERFVVSWSLARVIAEIAYDSGRAA